MASHLRLLNRLPRYLALAGLSWTAGSAAAAAPGLGTPPPADALPRAEFAFEARATLLPAKVVGVTVTGPRQYIPITGGTVEGPKFKGEILPGGWDYQLKLAGGCTSLTADYFWRAQDGTVIHILNAGVVCPDSVAGTQRRFLRPQFEAPKGPHEWMTHATFVATLEPEMTQATAGKPAELVAVRLKFYQVK